MVPAQIKSPWQNIVATTMTNHAQQFIISSLILVLNQIHRGYSLLLIFGGSKHIDRTDLLIIILTGGILCNAVTVVWESVIISGQAWEMKIIIQKSFSADADFAFQIEYSI